MKKKKFPITQVTISNKIGRPINSMVQMSNWKDFYIQPDLGLKFFGELFDDLPWEKNDLGKTIGHKKASITFDVFMKGVRLFMEKKDESEFPVDYFLKKKFKSKSINHLFGTVFSQFYKFIKNELPRELVKIEIQFLREKVENDFEKNIENKNENFEGSILVLHRGNIVGGESQILEKQNDGSSEIIFQQKLEAGDFVFLKNISDLKLLTDFSFHFFIFNISDN